MPSFPRVSIPEVALVRRHFSTECLKDVDGELRRELDRVQLASRVEPGQRIAITAGSRGIDNLALIVRTIVTQLKALGAHPFIVPAMGSHGGATAEGQLELIAEYGITEESIGCSIVSSMETVAIGRTPQGATVHMDANAYSADGVVLVNRIKNHTAFRAPIESGLCKMMAIGLGKQKGAESIHGMGLAANIPEAAAVMIGTGKIVLGVGTVENPRHQTIRIVAAPPEEIHETDRKLLKLAAAFLPRLPFDELDVLVIDRVGKNISGSGMDFNVIGLWRRTLVPPFTPRYERIVVLDVTPESHGNCVGIGLADFTTRALYDRLDLEKTYWNALTASAPMIARIPVVLDTDVEAVEVALKSANPRDAAPRLARIKNTLELGEFYASAPLLEELSANSEFEIVRNVAPMPRDQAGNLLWE